MSSQIHGRSRVPVVSRIEGDTLVELVYDPAKATTALVVSRFNGLWNLEQELEVTSGETLVPYAATNNLITNKCVLLASMPTEYGNKSELLEDIRAYVHKYVDLSDDFEQIATHYVLLTWVYDAFAEVPYLRFLGDWGTGKTRALTVIGSVCYKPFFASGASTVSPIFHIQDAFAGTLILDEADMAYSDAKAELVKILNNGTARGMPVLRSIVNRHRELNPYAFKVYGPKLVATRDRFEDPALESRLITEQTGSAALRTDIPISLPDGLSDDALALRNRLLHYRLCEFFKIKADTQALAADWDPRLKQMASPILNLADDAETRASIQTALFERFEQSRSAQAAGPESAVLASALSLTQERLGQDISIGQITQRFNEAYADFEPRSSRWIGSILRNRFRLLTRKSKGVYVVPAFEHQKVAALAARHGIAPL